MTVISYAHEVIFLKTRKTAGTSVELWLSSIAGSTDVLAPLDPADEQVRAGIGRRAQNHWIPAHRYGPRDVARRLAGRRPRYYNHMPADAVRTLVGDKVWDSFLKVTVERDRYDRALSMFRWKTRGSNEADLAEFLHRFPLDKLANAPIYSIDGEVVADVVLDYASLDDDTTALQRLLGVPETPLPRSKVSNAPLLDSRSLLGVEGRRIVDRACQYDVALTLSEKRPGVVRR